MSFSAETKNELAHVTNEKKCCMLAEIAGFIRMCGSVGLAGLGKFKIVATTENPAVARHYKKLIKEYFDVDASVEVGQGQTLKKGKFYNLILGPDQLSEQILRETGILMIKEGFNYFTDGIYEGLIKTKCCKKAFLRGAFLGSGTISNPDKGYHFEIVCASQALSGEMKKLINSFVGLHSKNTQRKKEYIVYLKKAEEITDVLALMGAHSQVFVYEDVRIKKEMRNQTNRINNCDNANIDKAIAAGEKQIRAINKIRDSKGLDWLPEKLKEVALLRLANPQAPLTELGEMLNPPLKKSGVNKRMMKLEELSKEV